MHRVSVVLLIAAVAIAAPGPKDKPVYYYPVKVGDTLEYEARESDKTFLETEVVTNVEPKEGGTIVTVARKDAGKITPVSRVEVTAKGLARTWYLNEAADPPVPLLKLPATPGATWTDERTTTSDGLPISPVKYATVGVEDVEVPAGRFKAVRVDAEPTIGPRTIKHSFWYAPGVGVVKHITVRGPNERVVVLKSFTSGK
jgi:hypothetical protein